MNPQALARSNLRRGALAEVPVTHHRVPKFLSRFPLPILSAALYALAFPPWGFSWLAWVALVPFLFTLLRVGPRGGALAGLIWGTVAIWAIAYWVPAALTFYYEQPAWFGVLFCVASSVIFWGSFYAAFATSASWIAARSAGFMRAFLLALLWVSCELGRARLLTGEPWLLFGYALIPHVTLIQIADLGGVYLLSFVVAFVNASLTELCILVTRHRSDQNAMPWRHAPATVFPLIVVVAATYAYGAFRLATPLPASPTVPITVVQGNNDLGMQWRQEFYGQGLDLYLRMSAEAAEHQPKLIVWPESAVTFFLGHEPQYQALIARMLAATGAELIAGAPHYEDDDPARPQFFNSAFHLTAEGRLDGRYDKAHLLPFAEYFPLRTIELLRRHFERVRSFTPGDGNTLLMTGAGPAAVVICFEAIFPELVRQRMRAGAGFLVNLSNDVWLGHDAGPAQHATMVALRAVENRTWVIRATTTGISAIIDPFGRVQARSETFTAALLHGHIVPMQVDTAYKRFGDVFAYGCVLIAVVTMLILAPRHAAQP